MSGDEDFDVVWPLGRTVSAVVADTIAPSDLSGRTVAFIWDYLFKGAEMFQLIQEEISRRYDDVTFVPPEVFGDIQAATRDGKANLAALPDRLHQNDVDVAVVAVGACGGCMPAIIRAASVAEAAGVPTVAIGGEGFEALGHSVARSLGIGHIPIVVYPGVIPSDTSEVFTSRVSEVIVPGVLQALTARSRARTGGPTEPSEVEPAMRDIVFSGTLDQVQEHFEEQGWTDGLPVIPPTLDRVEAFLQYTDRDPSEVLAVLAHEKREATVWDIAVNGVMAGCRSEYLPILLSIVECLADPQYTLEQAGSTTGFEPLVVVSGPLVEELNFNSGIGVMRAGRRANTSIGRFTRLFMRNVPGFRIPPD